MGNRRVFHVIMLLALFAAACTSAREQAGEPLADATQATTAVDPTIATTTSSEPPATTASPPTSRFPPGLQLNVAYMADTEGLENIIELTPEFFTGTTGVNVEFIEATPEMLRDLTTRHWGERVRPDVFAIHSFEAPLFGANAWIPDLTELAAGSDYNIDDVLGPVRSAFSTRGELYALPFHAESSTLMFNQAVMNAAGIAVPDEPTWDDVHEIAAAVHTTDVAGICLNGTAGWAELGASLTTIVNTFGGTWWESNQDGSIGEAQINQAGSGFRAATEFYVELAQNYGVSDPATANFDRCLDEFQGGKVAMWYGSTRATRILEADDSPVAGNVGYAFAPTNLTNASSSLSAWGFTTIRHAPTQTDIEEFVQWDAAREFILWATSPEFAQLAAENLPDGWADAPQGTRQSTYENPAYLDANQPYAETVLGAITTAPLHNPGTTPRPGIGGVQYVGVPEFQHVSAECSEQISLAISREQAVDTALDACQKVATEFTS